MNKNDPTEQHQDSETKWQPCASGDLSQFVSVMKKRKQVSRFITGAEIVTACLIIGMVGFFGMNQLSGPSSQTIQVSTEDSENFCPGGIYCPEVIDHAKDYVSNLLDQELTQKIEAHLVNCPHCQKKVDQLRANMDNNAADQKAALLKQAKWEAYLLALNQ